MNVVKWSAKHTMIQRYTKFIRAKVNREHVDLAPLILTPNEELEVDGMLVSSISFKVLLLLYFLNLNFRN